MNKRTSMRDIATQAGVSVMTVSLAFRDSKRVSVKTRNRILKIAKEMDFIRDPALSALVNYRHQRSERQFAGMIAYLNNFDEPHITQNITHHRELFEGAQQAAKHMGYKLEEFWLNAPDLQNRLSRISDILATRGIQGLIVGPQQSSHTKLDLKWELFSSVQLFFSLESPRLHTVSTDIYWAVQKVFTELCQCGYKRIGFVSEVQTDERVNNLYSAAYFACQYKLPEKCVRLAPMLARKIQSTTLGQWYKKEKPDAVIAFTPKAIELLRSSEFTNGKTVGIASPYPHQGFDDIAHITVDRHIIGARAMRLLTSLIEQNEKGIPTHPVTHSIIPGWRTGDSIQKVGTPIQLLHPAR